MDLLQQIEGLYNQGLSMSEVAERLNINMWRVRSLMKRHKIARRDQAETHKIQFLKRPLSYKKKKRLTSSEKLLHHAGIMLYWAEGSKAGKDTVDFANCNERMIYLFLKMLREIYRVDESKLRIQLYCFANQDVQQLTNYWSNFLNIPTIQFIKPYVRQDFDVTKSHKMPRGLAHVRYSDTRLLMDIKQEIDIMSSAAIS